MLNIQKEAPCTIVTTLSYISETGARITYSLDQSPSSDNFKVEISNHCVSTITLLTNRLLQVKKKKEVEQEESNFPDRGNNRQITPLESEKTYYLVFVGIATIDPVTHNLKLILTEQGSLLTIIDNYSITIKLLFKGKKTGSEEFIYIILYFLT